MGQIVEVEKQESNDNQNTKEKRNNPFGASEYKVI